MAYLSRYQSANFSKDWVLYYDKQVAPMTMIRAYEAHEIEFLVWTRERRDSITAVWIQTPKQVTRWTIKSWFPQANWVGSTGGHEEYQAWFKVMNGDRFMHRGRFHQRIRKGMRAGRTEIDAICEAVAALSMADLENDRAEAEIGTLVRTYAQYF